MQRYSFDISHSSKVAMKFLLSLMFLVVIAACSKSSSTPDPLVGTWKLSELRADPGDGSGKFLPAEKQVTITFTADGQYLDSRDNIYNRFSQITTDTIKLFHQVSGQSKLLAIQDISENQLMYYTNWPWCGGPYGEKFIRQGK